MISYIGEIKLWAIDWAPVDWRLCDGSMMTISENAALYSLIGTIYGGNGTSTFALPDLRGRVPVCMNWSGGPNVGTQAGVESVTLAPAEMPRHIHNVNAVSTTGNDATAQDAHIASPGENLYGSVGTLVYISPKTVSTAGGNQSHDNMQPYLALNYYICTKGEYPPRP